MGCVQAGPPIIPQEQGDGVNRLYWIPNENMEWRARQNIKGRSHAMFLVNQVAIWKKLSGETVDQLPLQPLPIQIERAESTKLMSAWDFIPLIYQGQVLEILNGGNPVVRRFPSHDDIVERSKTNLRGATMAQVVLNEYTMLLRLQGAGEPGKIPHEASDVVKERAGMNLLQAWNFQILVNQEAMWNKMPFNQRSIWG
mmetsp:Transcript_1625/g.3551  ORF Transcript_1625/g.3551 Transcript_1625/m.3551 type:complete len:198 (-) Transcript_1625:16-609(-)|eukprot:CAMPEP_0206465390 /NCGR_PEP_ID=MMETSP0324_2-20121206/27799_1 /ASSEMBLY_ACC=CAM_ASM_000836 /TAXON_ID=2866 /ORGANISM="Crypthecodinium cohnii, Strain Seligo" /LENGTH=197 /DNA_ID=CAMNT_0053938235 /DNA_START=103 /DNA_END=692 /DNA_ORIENTATION=+